MKKQALFVITIFAVAIFLSAVIVASEDKSSTEPNVKTEKAEDAESAAYTKVIEGRTQKILDVLGVEDQTKKKNVHDAIMAQYRFLNDWDNNNKDKIKELKRQLDAIQAQIDELNGQKKEQHDKFVSELQANLAPEQVEMVKDKLTYNKVQVTYDGYCAMLPELTENQKAYILKMFKEARELAIDGGSSEEKTAVFEKYKGRINNFLGANGYDLKQASKDWQERIKAEREKQKQPKGN
jgi:hypothetical protein